MPNPIKAFFAKKKADIKFKQAGAGQKLGDSSAAAASDAQRARQINAETQKKEARAQAAGASRSGPSLAQIQAAEAAQARQASQKTEDWDKKRSQAAIRAHAQKELEAERAAEAEAGKLKERYSEKPVVEIQAPSACPGVFFHCPLVGDEILPKADMIARIKAFLYENLEEEKGLTACLLIHTLGKEDRVKTCVDTLCKYIDNILLNPTEEKFRRIRKTNKAYAERVATFEGTEPFLEAAGFESTEMDGEPFWIFPESSVNDERLETLQTLKDALMTSAPIKAELDRSIKVLDPGQASARFSLPQDFFTVSAEELKREQIAKADVVEREGMLRTKAMREREEAREKRKYRYTLIRIRFPNGLVLQGTFSVYERYRLVHDFVAESLELPLPFVLYDGKRRLEAPDYDTVLADLSLAPSALLTFNWHPEVAAEVTQQMGANPIFLKDDLMSLIG